MTTTRKLVYGGSAQVVVRVAGLAVATITLPLLARYLGNASYGRLTIILTIAVIATTAGDLGLPLLLSRDLPGAADPQRWLSRFWSVRIATALSLWAAAVIVVLAWTLDAELQRGLLIALAGVPVTIVATSVAAWFNAELDPAPAAAADLVGRIIWLSGVVAAVTFGFGLVGLLAMITLAPLGSLATILAMRREARSLAVTRLHLNTDMLRAAAPLAVVPILGIVYSRSDTLILTAFVSDAEVGIYGALWRFVEAAILIAGVAGGLLLPLFAGSSPAELANRYRRSIRLVAAALFPAAVIAALAGPELLPLLGGDGFFVPVSTDFGRVVPDAALVVLMAALALMAVGIVNGARMIAQRMVRAVVRHFILVVIVNVGLGLVLIPRWSYMGAAVASLCSEVVATAHSTATLRRHNGRLGLMPALRWPVLIAAASGVAFAATSPLGVLVGMAAGTAAGGTTLFYSPVGKDLLSLGRRVP